MTSGKGEIEEDEGELWLGTTFFNVPHTRQFHLLLFFSQALAILKFKSIGGLQILGDVYNDY